MSETWPLRLVAAMEDDPPFPELHDEPDADGDPTVELCRRPAGDVRTDGTSEGVAGHIITAAAIGYPTPEDAEQILSNPAALAQLARLWASMPPDPDRLVRATTDPALDQLLAATGHRPDREPDQRQSDGRERDDPGQPSTPKAPTWLASRRRRRSHALGTADEAERHLPTWPGDQLTRKRLDRTVAVNVGYAGSDGAGHEGGIAPRDL